MTDQLFQIQAIQHHIMGKFGALAVLQEEARADAQKVCLQELMKILKEEGPSAFQMPREAAVVHETGHAIVAHHEGTAVARVSVFDDGIKGIWGGYTKFKKKNPDIDAATTPVPTILSQARIVIAGLVSEATSPWYHKASSIDELLVSQMLAHWAARRLQPR